MTVCGRRPWLFASKLHDAFSVYSARSLTTEAVPNTTLKIINSNLSLRSPGLAPEGNRNSHLVILFEWMLAKRKHVEKFENYYLNHGMDVLTVKAHPFEVLRPAKAQAIASSIIQYLDDPAQAKTTTPYLVHGFSVGGYLIGETLVKLNNGEDINTNVSKRLVAQVFDSPVDMDGIPRGFSNVLTSNTALRAGIKSGLQMFLRTFKKSVFHYENASVAFKENKLGVPSLFLFSILDPVSCPERIQSVVDDFQNRELPVISKCWNNSAHVSHFHRNPQEYLHTLTQFLQTYDIIPYTEDTENSSVSSHEEIGLEKRSVRM